MPIVSGFGINNGLQGVSFVPFGVQLNFTPFITDRDRIRLQLNANVSSRDVGVHPAFKASWRAANSETGAAATPASAAPGNAPATAAAISARYAAATSSR